MVIIVNAASCSDVVGESIGSRTNMDGNGPLVKKLIPDPNPGLIKHPKVAKFRVSNKELPTYSPIPVPHSLSAFQKPLTVVPELTEQIFYEV